MECGCGCGRVCVGLLACLIVCACVHVRVFEVVVWTLQDG